MLTLTTAQMAALDQERRDKLIARIDAWLLKEDSAWPQADPAQRTDIIGQLLVYAEQSGMRTEVDYAVFCRSAILLRADWKAFIEAEPQKAMLLDKGVRSDSKRRAFFSRCYSAAKLRARGTQGGTTR